MSNDHTTSGRSDSGALDPDERERIARRYRDESPVDSTENRGVYRRIRDQLLSDKKAIFGATMVLLFVFTAIFAPMIAPYEQDDTFGINQGPNSYSESDVDGDGEMDRVWHVLGTDSFGHDLFTRIVFGARISLLVALTTVAFAFTVGTAIGLIAGYYGGLIDELLMRYVDFQWAFPSIILAAGLIAFLGGLGVTNVVIAIGVAFIDDFARLVRGEVLSIREEEYVLAARAIGTSDRRIMTKEILPNAVAPIIVQMTLMIPLAIIAEAALSFLGLGVKPTTPTWGLLLAEGRQYINQAWWISVFPGLAIMVVVLAFNMFGDSLRDAFDVKQSEVSEK
ncbi:ABC transporter permease [Halorubrum sp. 48-1-W]|uniref:ABC transporter permease n=1 Tax=Halorubrum sp. 48-1-W TaxID=2249761 RepID=UPI000DCD2C0E|nr:ABC transporter permease [Halorubrum sp. 48-1-W]RAW46119.1 ABC transporter permease [Halorubrum sp. 48-1-W]